MSPRPLAGPRLGGTVGRALPGVSIRIGGASADAADAPFIKACRTAGIDAVRATWNDARVDWTSFDACLVRTTWDWHKQPDAFAPNRATPYFGYGYQFWLYPGAKRRFALLGVYGQSVFVDPELKLVMVITAVAKNASVGKETFARERDAVWRGLVATYGSW